MSKRTLPEINAGSMADIAFLLLIFFLVTTTMDIDSGILRKIPEKQKKPSEVILKNKNVLEVSINKNNELLVENNSIKIVELEEIATRFIDNGGGLDKNKTRCTWCKGDRNPKSSDHPTKAVISIKTDRSTSYETYISVLDKLNVSYAKLRNRLSKELYNVSYSELLIAYKNNKTNKEVTLKRIQLIREKYPLLISDASIEN